MQEEERTTGVDDPRRPVAVTRDPCISIRQIPSNIGTVLRRIGHRPPSKPWWPTIMGRSRGPTPRVRMGGTWDPQPREARRAACQNVIVADGLPSRHGRRLPYPRRHLRPSAPSADEEVDPQRAQMDADSRGCRATGAHGLEGLPCNPGATREVNLGMAIRDAAFFAPSRLQIGRAHV